MDRPRVDGPLIHDYTATASYWILVQVWIPVIVPFHASLEMLAVSRGLQKYNRVV
jgi:hypothetical protein